MRLTRRQFLKRGASSAASIAAVSALAGMESMSKDSNRKPNIVFVFADQLRFCDM